MIERFEAGKRYIWTGLKTDPDSWLPGLDGKPHTCVFASKDGRYARFAGQPDPITAYYYGDVLDRISEVPASNDYILRGTPVRLTAKGKDILVGRVVASDTNDPHLFYQVEFTEGSRVWCRAEWVERLPDDTKPLPPHIQNLKIKIDPSEEYIKYTASTRRAPTTRQEHRREVRRKLLGL